MDKVIKEISSMKNQIYNQQEEIEILNKRIDELLKEIDYRDRVKNVNLI